MQLHDVPGRRCVLVAYENGTYMQHGDEPASWPEEVRHLLGVYRVSQVEVRPLTDFVPWKRAVHVSTEDDGTIVFLVA